MRKDRDYIYVKTVTGCCRECSKRVPARIKIVDGSVFQERLCPDCGNNEVMIAENADWYMSVMKRPINSRRPEEPITTVKNGCALDCGICPNHVSACNLPVFSITNACNLQCPICFTYNRKDKLYNMSRAEIAKILDFLIEREGEMDLINITGGEPTLHPNLLQLLDEANRPQIGRITLNSNGIKLAKNETLCRELAARGIYVVLSFDTFKKDTSLKIHGRDMVDIKLQALENLERFGIGTTLLFVMAKGVNDNEVGDVIELATKRKFIRSVTIQNMTFTGYGGKNFEPRLSMTMDGAMQEIEKRLSGAIKFSDFHPLPSAHPLCYSIGYFFNIDGKLLPFRRLFSEEKMLQILGQRYFLRPGAEFEDFLTEAMADIWAEGDEDNLLPTLKKITKALYPVGKNLGVFERQKIAEEHLLTLYIHPHMDEDNFDNSRVMSCPDLVPSPEGTLIPACAYNVFYRMHDSRFWVEDEK
ncbi:radical SAM protein [Candidatus Riflebacteria bacterium]